MVFRWLICLLFWLARVRTARGTLPVSFRTRSRLSSTSAASFNVRRRLSVLSLVFFGVIGNGFGDGGRLVVCLEDALAYYTTSCRERTPACWQSLQLEWPGSTVVCVLFELRRHMGGRAEGKKKRQSIFSSACVNWTAHRK